MIATLQAPDAALYEDQPYIPQGGARCLFEAIELGYDEILFEGPAGTGKSRATGEAFVAHTEEAARVRMCVVRQVRDTLRESVMTTLEELVFVEGHEALLTGGSRGSRLAYEWPSTGGHWALAGLDKPSKTYSTEYTGIWCEEAIEISLDAFEKLLRCLRWPHGAHNFIVLTTNPGSRHHWINRRFPQGVRTLADLREHYQRECARVEKLERESDGLESDNKRVRILSRHEDNPYCTTHPKGIANLRNLRAMTGVRRKRLYEGLWVGAENLVWPDYDEDVHVLRWHARQHGDRWFLDDSSGNERIELRWFVASMDFGAVAPGCLMVWGFDRDRRAYCVAEVYEPGRNPNWWADVLTDLFSHYRFRRVIADCADAGARMILNERLSQTHGRGVGSIVHGSDKSKGKTHGLGVVRDALIGKRLFWLHDDVRLIRGKNGELAEEGLPTCSTEEIPGYTYRKLEGLAEDQIGKVRKDEAPDPACPNHGCDATEYLATWAFGATHPNLTPAPAPAADIFPPDYTGMMT